MFYAFILGKNTALSVAEIISILKREAFIFVIISISSKALIIKTDKSIEDPQSFLDSLGGTIKICQIFSKTEIENIESLILKYISKSFSESKFVFGLSFYGSKNRKMGFEIKKELKKIGINSRLIQGKEESLSAPEIKNNRIIEKGADFNIIGNKNDVFLGVTIVAQDYESYSHRDYNRPRRNAKSGMLPPKIAQIMLNLVPIISTANPILIYDPFCGQGTVLQEALLTHRNAIGSDISKERVSDTIQNLRWLAKEYSLKISPEEIVFQNNALTPKSERLRKDPDTIVSEVYLGPPLTGREQEEELLETLENLRENYGKFLKSQYLAPSVQCLVLALPFYKYKNKNYYLNIIDDIQKIGYNVISPIEEGSFDLVLLPEYNKERKTILYSRPDQIVGREIIILRK